MDRFFSGAFVGAIAGGIAAIGAAVVTMKWPAACAVDGTLFWTGAGAIGSAAAAIAAVWIAVNQNSAKRVEEQARQRVAAGLLYVPCRRLMTTLGSFIEDHEAFSRIKPGPDSRQVREHAIGVDVGCDAILAILQQVNLNEAAFLPAKIGERLAIGCSTAELASRSASVAVRCYNEAKSDSERYEAAHGAVSHQTAERARNNIAVFVNWCHKHLGMKIEPD
jgi:hypothetical protein